MRTAILLTFAIAVSAAAQERSPARYESGLLPALPAMVVGGGEVMLEVTVSPRGQVTRITPLRATPPFTDVVTGVVKGWRFKPAEEHRASLSPVESRVLVAAVFRPPALNGPTLGELPKEVVTASSEVAYPSTLTMPPFPPMASNSGVVLLEATVENNGNVGAIRVVRSAPPFDDAARDALRGWKFRPARIDGAPRAAIVYVVFGFPVPVGIGG